MISKWIQKKAILPKFLEQCIKILLIRECKNIRNLKIDIIASSMQIIKGELQLINIIAEDINYKDLLFDKIELEANEVKLNFKLKNKELNFKYDPSIKFKILLSENSIKKILFSNDWNWIGSLISKEILNQGTLEDIKLKNGKVLMKDSNMNETNNEMDHIKINTNGGKIHLKNERSNKFIEIPIEDKIYIKNIKIENNSIIINANSTISF